MTQPITEVKTDTPSSPNTDTQGAPTVAENEPMSNDTAASEAVKIEENLTENIIGDLAGEVAVENLPGVKAAAAKDAAHIEKLDEQVINAGVEVKDEHAGETMKALDGTGAKVVGETHPAINLGETVGTFNNARPETQTRLPGTLRAFNAIDSIKLENSNTNGPGLNRIEEERKSLLERVQAKWKILGGKKAA